MRVLSVFTIDPGDLKPPTQETMQRMGELIGEMRDKHVLVDTGGRSPDMLEVSVSRKNGRSTVTDGPFAESKELVGGFALLEVADRAEAIEWTNRFLDVAGNATCYLHEVSATPE
jgi:hypothetical protein